MAGDRWTRDRKCSLHSYTTVDISSHLVRPSKDLGRMSPHRINSQGRSLSLKDCEAQGHVVNHVLQISSKFHSLVSIIGPFL